MEKPAESPPKCSLCSAPLIGDRWRFAAKRSDKKVCLECAAAFGSA